MLEDREAINAVWVRLMDVRRKIYQNAGLPDYREYAWQERLRFDYTPADCETFHRAIEETVVPAAARVYERRRRQMGVETLCPWDINTDPMRITELNVDPLAREPLRPFATIDELKAKGSAVFHHVDPQLGAYFDTMQRESLLDLQNYKGKAAGAYCTSYASIKRPFVFMNAVGIADNVSTLLHECGHAFHVFERAELAYHPQRISPMEFNEVASMAMELLGAPYLDADGGFFTPQQAARARIEHLEGLLVFWPYMAVVDAFQHWVYTHHDDASDPANCDAAWAALWARFIHGVDYTGLDDHVVTGWHRKLHLYRYPFYYVEYGLAQLGATQIWRNALRDQAGAVASYRKALALGGTVTLPDLYAAAGVRFAFDSGTLGEIVALIEHTIAEMEAGA